MSFPWLRLVMLLFHEVRHRRDLLPNDATLYFVDNAHRAIQRVTSGLKLARCIAETKMKGLDAARLEKLSIQLDIPGEEVRLVDRVSQKELIVSREVSVYPF